ncbi:hypothetical protein K3X48_05995 [Aliiroseovarius crassostreae]|uniref:Uncharacterized protein n=1 Tax=Aliiroseovarius crassostreae TaxID=154981 RepID=A0A9Q9LW35_9RHOB|nr:hypothetical protein [Aliiroseovarius crassostreae]UWP96526.1 hypothetical protein K3X48_05995 [Aliiroseovarius crassostreae]
MNGKVISNAVKLEQRRDNLSDQLYDAEVQLHGELVEVVRQIAEGKSVPPAIALVLARNQFPDVDFLD